MEAETRKRLAPQIEQITKTPLKPQQRLWILVECFASVDAPDDTSRMFSANAEGNWLWLKLPKDAPIGFFHAKVKDGGLGIPSWRYEMPERIVNCQIVLQFSTDPAVAALCALSITDRHCNLVSKWSQPITLGWEDIKIQNKSGHWNWVSYEWI